MRVALPFPDFSPELLSIPVFGLEFALRWYALAYIAGFLIAWRMGMAAVNRPNLWTSAPPMKPRQIEDMMTWIILGVILGGRLGYTTFYQPFHYLSNPAQVLMVWQGGMSFHGGLLGVALAVLLYCRANSVAPLAAADIVAHTVAPGLFLGRVANFVNAELWGRPSELPWAVVFPGEAAQHCPGIENLCARHPSQLYEAVLEGLVLGGLLIWMVYRRTALKQTGLVTGTFLAGYGIVRFIVEFARQPDAQFVSEGNPLGLVLHISGYGLTMGQLLSLPMVALGLWLALRRGTGT